MVWIHLDISTHYHLVQSGPKPTKECVSRRIGVQFIRFPKIQEFYFIYWRYIDKQNGNSCDIHKFYSLCNFTKYTEHFSENDANTLHWITPIYRVFNNIFKIFHKIHTYTLHIYICHLFCCPLNEPKGFLPLTVKRNGFMLYKTGKKRNGKKKKKKREFFKVHFI